MPEIPNSPITATDLQLLGESVDTLAQSLIETKEEQSRQKRNTRWLAVSIALDIVLSIAIAIGGYLIDQSQNQISAIQEAQIAEIELNRSNQCALTNMLLRFESASTTSPTVAEEEKQRRIDAYEDLHKIHADLRCPSK
jgi:hypothetical protein